MRKINTSDVFKLARILKKGNVEENIAKAIEGADIKNKNKVSEKIGIKIMLALFESCGEPEVEPLVYELFGGIAEIEPSTIETQTFDKTIEMFKEISKENNLTSFFKQASQLI